MRWLTPVIPALWEAEAGGSRGQEIKTIFGQHDKTLSLLKIQKLAGHVLYACNPRYLGGWGRRIAWTQEAEVAASQEIMPLHSSLGDKVRLCPKEKKKKGQAWWHASVSQLLKRLRQENSSSPGGRGCSEPRSCHCTPSWVTEWYSVSKKEKKRKEKDCRDGGLRMTYIQS